jgi:hypothetical protein
MILGFKRQFAPFVEDGSKTHTIRARGQRRRFVAFEDVCDCYVDPRQRTMRLLGRWPCVKVEEIQITAAGNVLIEDVLLTASELTLFAWRDGFRSSGPAGAVSEMMAFWKGQLPFRGDLIHWKYNPNGATR